MEIHLFSQQVKGLMIAGTDFDFYLSTRALIIIGALALAVGVLRRIKKVRGL